MNPVDVMEDILKFRGFLSSSFKEKLKWLFILYPFFLVIFILNLFWFTYWKIESVFKKKGRK